MLATRLNKDELAARVQEDHSVAHQVVVPEIISIEPSRMSERPAALTA